MLSSCFSLDLIWNILSSTVECDFCGSLFGRTLWEAVLKKEDGDLFVWRNNDYFVVNFPYGVVIIEDKDITGGADFNRCVRTYSLLALISL